MRCQIILLCLAAFVAMCLARWVDDEPKFAVMNHKGDKVDIKAFGKTNNAIGVTRQKICVDYHFQINIQKFNFQMTQMMLLVATPRPAAIFVSKVDFAVMCALVIYACV